ncbi:MAG: type III polyketide synthase [Acidobacteriota bacterium]
MSVGILGIGRAVPELAVSQGRAAELSEPLVCSDERQRRLLGVLFRRSGVETRHSVVLEADGEGTEQGFYPPRHDLPRGPGTADRMQRFETEAPDLAESACRGALRQASTGAAGITHLVTVSCTGFHAPGIDVALVRRLGLDSGVARTHVGFMGCHGIFNGLGVARSIVEADPAARPLVCAVELCSLHFQYLWDSEKLVANALFADGAGAAVCGPAADAGLSVEATGSVLLPDSSDAMTWRIGDHGFEMTLAARVPDLIRAHAAGWMETWLEGLDLSPAEIGTWAVHPGGPRILDAFEDAMELADDALAESRQVLARYGNMSSVTILFILERLLQGRAPGPWVAVGFGPGMVMEALLFRPR